MNDAPACTLYSGVTYVLEADGTIETICHEITRLNSRKAIDKLGEYHNIAYDPAYEKLTLNEARVIKADGRIVSVEPKHVQLRDTVTDYRVYDHSKELVISFPTLETGDSIEVKWTTRGKNPEYQGRFFMRYTFGDDLYPVVCDEVRVQLPKACPLHYAVTGGKLEPTIQDSGERRTYHWRRATGPSYRWMTTCRRRKRCGCSSRCPLFPHGTRSFSGIGTFARTAGPPTPEICAGRPERDERPADAPGKGPRAHILAPAAHSLCLCGERHDYTPHPPAVVFDNAYGDCKDTSQLLAVMLKEAGIAAAQVTLGVLDDGQVLPRPVALGHPRHSAGNHRRHGPLDRYDGHSGRLGPAAAR